MTSENTSIDRRLAAIISLRSSSAWRGPTANKTAALRDLQRVVDYHATRI